jgi:hypothetical protein
MGIYMILSVVFQMGFSTYSYSFVFACMFVLMVGVPLVVRYTKSLVASAVLFIGSYSLLNTTFVELYPDQAIFLMLVIALSLFHAHFLTNNIKF